MHRNKRTVSDSEPNGTRPSRLRSESSERQGPVPASSRDGVRLLLPLGEPDLEALRAVTREWLVPRLVQEFLREHGVELKQPSTPVNQKNELSDAAIRGGRGLASRRER
jgi:hypothetical protein